MNFLQKSAEFAWSLLSPEWYQRNGYGRMAALLGGGMTTATGETMSVELAMTCAPVYICTRAVTEPLAAMPFPVMRKVGEDTQFLRDEPLFKMLNSAPNNYQDSDTFRRVLTHHALNRGNGFARIFRRSNDEDGEAYAMQIIHPRDFDKIDIVRGEATYIFKRELDGNKVFKRHEILHLMNFSEDGMTGVGAVELGRDPIAQAMAIEAFGSTFFARGGLKAGLLKKTIPFRDKTDRDKWNADFQAEYRKGRESFHKNLLVEGDWDYKSIGADPTEAQLVEASAAMVPKIARFYGVTPHLAGDLSRAHFANVEHLWIEYLNITQGPWMKRWEQAIHRTVMTPKQRDQGWYCKHNTSAFMRGDFSTRMAGYATRLQNGMSSINEVRALEDEDPVPGGDALHIQLNMQTVSGTGDPTVSELAQLVKISDGKPKAKAS